MSDDRGVARADVWSRLRQVTAARIGLGRGCEALPTAAMLELQYAHALARDAVHRPLDEPALLAALAGLETVVVESQAPDAHAYLTRPDLGRRLSEASVARLAALHASGGGADMVIVLGDGLSAGATQDTGPALVRALIAQFLDWRLSPVVAARRARVALGDEIGAALGARMVVMLIGERPGLSAADSLGAYLTWNPAPGRHDAERNCVSNIRPGGMPVAEAAARIAWLARAARGMGQTGVALKDGYAAPTTLPASE